MIIPSTASGFVLHAMNFTLELCLGLVLFLPSLDGMHGQRFTTAHGARLAGLFLVVAAYLTAGFIPLGAFGGDNPTIGIIATYTGVMLVTWLYLHYVMRVPDISACIVTVLGYSSQHLAVCIVKFASTLLHAADASPRYWAVYCAGYAVTYALVYMLLARRMTIVEDKVRDKQLWVLLCSFVAILDIAIGPIIDRFHTLSSVIFHWYDALTIVLAMVIMWLTVHNDALSVDLEHERQLDALRRQQYEITKETIDSINITAHDLKANLRTLVAATASASTDASTAATAANPSASTDVTARVRAQAVQSLEESLATYSSIYRTGNVALDTVLTQKSMTCAKLGIRFLCMADGSAVQHMREEDIFTLFMNCLDNAIEAVKDVQPAERRIIDVAVTSDGERARIHVANYFNGMIRERNGALQTTKRDTQHHGFGMRSMQRICAHYQGTLTTHHDNEMFTVDIVI